MEYLQRAKVWYIDATFRVMREPFKQLLSVHSFVCTGDAQKQVPLCFVLMSRRKKSDYTAVFRALLELLQEPPAVQKAVLDFERAANHIIPAFQQLKERCPRTNEKLLDLLPYFDENWVNSTSRPPASWSIFKHMVRTNDDVEGWHYSE